MDRRLCRHRPVFRLHISVLRDGSRQLISLARNEAILDRPGCAAQDALSALARASYSGPDVYREAIDELRTEMTHAAPHLFQVNGFQVNDRSSLQLALSPAKSRLAIAEANEVTLYAVPAPEKVPSSSYLHRWSLAPECTDENVIVTRAALTPDAARIAIGLNNGHVFTFPTDKNSQIGCDNGARTASIESLAFSGTGDLAVASADGIRINDSLISSLDTTALVFDTDGDQLAVGLRDGSVKFRPEREREVAPAFPP